MKCFIDELLEYDTIGFDLDGTLYDEYEFIFQAYSDVSHVISVTKKINEKLVHDVLCRTWLRNGSSADIFQLSASQLGTEPFDEMLIWECVDAFRNCDFSLRLTPRCITILDMLINYNKTIFLVTDGNSVLQRKKLDALGLWNWFSGDKIAISGDYGTEYQKPSSYMFTKIKIETMTKNKTVYVGDRDVDSEFSKNSGIDFIKAKVMQL